MYAVTLEGRALRGKGDSLPGQCLLSALTFIMKRLFAPAEGRTFAKSCEFMQKLAGPLL